MKKHSGRIVMALAICSQWFVGCDRPVYTDQPKAVVPVKPKVSPQSQGGTALVEFDDHSKASIIRRAELHKIFEDSNELIHYTIESENILQRLEFSDDIIHWFAILFDDAIAGDSETFCNQVFRKQVVDFKKNSLSLSYVENMVTQCMSDHETIFIPRKKVPLKNFHLMKRVSSENPIKIKAKFKIDYQDVDKYINEIKYIYSEGFTYYYDSQSIDYDRNQVRFKADIEMGERSKKAIGFLKELGDLNQKRRSDFLKSIIRDEVKKDESAMGIHFIGLEDDSHAGLVQLEPLNIINFLKELLSKAERQYGKLTCSPEDDLGSDGLLVCRDGIVEYKNTNYSAQAMASKYNLYFWQSKSSSIVVGTRYSEEHVPINKKSTAVLAHYYFVNSCDCGGDTWEYSDSEMVEFYDAEGNRLLLFSDVSHPGQ